MSSPLLSVLPSAVATGAALFQLLEDMKSAPFDIREIEKEMSQLCPILEQLRDFHTTPIQISVMAPSFTGSTDNKAESCISPGFVKIADLREENEKNLAALLMSCEEVFRTTAELLEKYNTEGKSSFVRQIDRLAWTLDGQRKAEKLKKRLETSKSTLSIALGLLTQNKIETTGDTVGLVHKDTQLIISQIQSLVGKLDEEEISSLLAEAPSEHSFMLRRYLESASSYAETIYSDSRPFGVLVSETGTEEIPEVPEAIPGAIPEAILGPTLETASEAVPKRRRSRKSTRRSPEFVTKPGVIRYELWDIWDGYVCQDGERLRAPESDDDFELEALCTVQGCPRGRDVTGNGFTNLEMFNIHMKLTHNQDGAIVLPKIPRRSRRRGLEKRRKRV